MMQRLPQDFTQDLYGDKMLREFSIAAREEEIEDYYKDYFNYSSIFKIRTIKRCYKDSRAKTDGLMECTYKNQTFYGIQETKFRKAFTDLQLKYQLVQALMYEWMFEMRKFDYNVKFYSLDSEKYFSYVYSDEISELKRKLWNIFPIAPECPSSIYKNPLVNDLLKKTEVSFHKELITDKFKLHEVVRSIFKHCLE